MAEMKLTVIVADRGHAYVYEAPTLHGPLTRIAALGNPTGLGHQRDWGTSPPGRAFNRSGGMHQTYSPKHSLREQSAANFARVIGKTIELSARSATCNGIVVVAAPRLLAAIRQTLSKRALERVIREVPKDLAHHPSRVIVDYLRAA